MKIYTWDEFCEHSPYKAQPVSMTLGVFDGLHLGHCRLMEELESGPGNIPLVFTFRRNPAEIMNPKTFAGNILTLDQKLERMQNLGVKGAIIIDFSHDFSKLTGIEFFSRILDRSKLKKVVLGENHRLGNRGETGAGEVKTFLEKDGVFVKIVHSLKENGGVISSTRIRELIKSGKLSEASDLLGYPFSLDLRRLVPEHTDGMFRVPREKCLQLLPPAGSYKAGIEENQEFFATKLILDNQYIQWNQNSDIPAKKIIFSYSD